MTSFGKQRWKKNWFFFITRPCSKKLLTLEMQEVWTSGNITLQPRPLNNFMNDARMNIIDTMNKDTYYDTCLSSSK